MKFTVTELSRGIHAAGSIWEAEAEVFGRAMKDHYLTHSSAVSQTPVSWSWKTTDTGPMCSVVDPQRQSLFSVDSAESRGGFRLPWLDAVKLLARHFIHPHTCSIWFFNSILTDTICTRVHIVSVVLLQISYVYVTFHFWMTMGKLQFWQKITQVRQWPLQCSFAHRFSVAINWGMQ